jgi:hypothetical protein
VAVINRLIAHPFVDKLKTKYGYPLATRLLSADEMLFLSYGYEEDPPMALPLAATDEPNRFCIQPYHRTATQADLTGKRCSRSVAATAADPRTSCAPCIQPPDHRHQDLHRRLERPRPSIRLDQNRRPNPQESKPSTNFKHGPLADEFRENPTGQP